MRPVSFPGFWRDCRGSVAVETAIAVSLLAIACAGVLEIVHSAWVSDRMDRAARAAARTIALAPDADAGSLKGLACRALREELDLGDGFDCNTKLSVRIDTNRSPETLLNGGGSDSDSTSGELVMVRIAWSGGAWNAGVLTAGDDEGARPFATAVAPIEPEKEG